MHDSSAAEMKTERASSTSSDSWSIAELLPQPTDLQDEFRAADGRDFEPVSLELPPPSSLVHVQRVPDLHGALRSSRARTSGAVAKAVMLQQKVDQLTASQAKLQSRARDAEKLQEEIDKQKWEIRELKYRHQSLLHEVGKQQRRPPAGTPSARACSCCTPWRHQTPVTRGEGAEHLKRLALLLSRLRQHLLAELTPPSDSYALVLIERMADILDKLQPNAGKLAVPSVRSSHPPARLASTPPRHRPTSRTIPHSRAPNSGSGRKSVRHADDCFGCRASHAEMRHADRLHAENGISSPEQAYREGHTGEQGLVHTTPDREAGDIEASRLSSTARGRALAVLKLRTKLLAAWHRQQLEHQHIEDLQEQLKQAATQALHWESTANTYADQAAPPQADWQAPGHSVPSNSPARQKAREWLSDTESTVSDNGPHSPASPNLAQCLQSAPSAPRAAAGGVARTPPAATPRTWQRAGGTGRLGQHITLVSPSSPPPDLYEPPAFRRQLAQVDAEIEELRRALELAGIKMAR